MLSMSSQFFSNALASEVGAANRLNTFAWRFSLLLLLSFSYSGSISANCAPLQDDSGNYQAFLDIKRDYLLAVQAECMKKSQDPPATQKAFLKLHNKYLDVAMHDLKKHNWSQLYRDAEAFLELKPTDPFSKIAVGRIINESNLHGNVLANCEMIVDSADQMEDYSLEARLYAIDAVHDAYYQANFQTPEQSRAMLNKHFDLLIEWMSQNDAPEHLQRLMFAEGHRCIRANYPLRGVLSGFLEKIEAAEGDLKPWLRSMLLGSLHSKQGYNARGTGAARTVGEAGWRQLSKSLEIAEREFKKAYTLHPERPEAATLMITIAMHGATDESERTWFDRAVKAEFNHMGAYERYRISLYPNWGGSNEAMIEFAEECAATGRYDTQVPLEMKEVFDRIYQVAGTRFMDEPLQAYMRDFDIYPEIHEICENYEKHIKKTDGFTTTDARFYRGLSFSIAYKMGLLEEAYELVKKYNGDVLTSFVRPTITASDDVALAYVVAVNSAAGEQVRSIEGKMLPVLGRDRTLKQSEALLVEIDKAAAKNDLPRAELYFKTKKELLEKEIEFHRGQWVTLDFTPDLRHWASFSGRYEAESLTSLNAANSDGTGQQISYNTSFPPPYEVELTVECLNSTGGNQSLVSGLIAGQMAESTGRVFWADTLSNSVGFAQPRLNPKGFITSNVKFVRLKVNVFDGFYEIFDRDGLGYASTKGFKDFEPGRIGLGHPPWLSIAGEVRYSDLKIRKLDFDAPTPLNDPKARVAYYLKRLEEKETYGSYFLLGMAEVGNRNTLKAIKAFQAAEKIYPTNALPIINAAHLMRRMRQYEKARKNLERALEICVGDQTFQRPEVLESLISIYASCPREKVRNGDKAVKYADELLELVKEKGPMWIELSAAAAAYAEAGQFEKAVEYAKQAIEVAKKTTRSDPGRLLYRLSLYEDGKPYHQQ